MINANKWAVAVEHAIGKLLNSFIVTDHKDFRLLKQCAKEVNYGHLQIIIYDFSTPRYTICSLSVCLPPCFYVLWLVSFFGYMSNCDQLLLLSLLRLRIPEHMLPYTNHPSTLSVLQCENHTVINVLVDHVIVWAFAYAVANILTQGFFIAFIERRWTLWSIFLLYFCCFSTLNQKLFCGMDIFF